jgi:hypothetical protein
MKKLAFQIYFNDSQLFFLDESTIPYDNSNDTSKEFEYGVMRRFWFDEESRKEIFQTHDLVGFISWRFNQKARITVKHFFDLIDKHEGYDCYAFNPDLAIIGSNNNIWIQGQTVHPNIIKYANILTKECYGYEEIEKRIHTLDNSAYCNYWLGNEFFWCRYIEFIEIARTWIMQNNKKYDNVYFNNKDYNIHLYPFIIERLWSEFIYDNKDIKCKIFNVRDHI